MPNPYIRSMREHSGRDLPLGEQQELGKPRGTSFDDEHANFLKLVIGLIDAGKIRIQDPQSFLQQDIYADLSPEWKKKVDIAIPNIITLLERIMDLHVRPEKDESVEMKNLIEMLWQAKQRIEEHVDVFVF